MYESSCPYCGCGRDAVPSTLGQAVRRFSLMANFSEEEDGGLAYRDVSLLCAEFHDAWPTRQAIQRLHELLVEEIGSDVVVEDLVVWYVDDRGRLRCASMLEPARAFSMGG